MMLNTAQKIALAALTFVCTSTASFAADYPAYDRKIEAAVKQIVAKKVGAIRGAYDIDNKVIKITEFQGPVRPAIVAVAALPENLEAVEEPNSIADDSAASEPAAPRVAVAVAPMIETDASVKMVQVAAIATRKVRVLSSFLYY